MRDAIRPHRKVMLLGIAAGLVWAVARVAIPSFAGLAVDRGIAHDNWRATAMWTVAILIAGAVQAVATGLRRFAAFGLAMRVEADIRMKLVAHLQRLHFAFHDHAQTGQLMAYANTDIQQIQNAILLIPLTIASTLQMIAVIVILGWRSPGLALFALGALPLLNFAATRFNRRMYPVGAELQQELSEVSGVVEETHAARALARFYYQLQSAGIKPAFSLLDKLLYTVFAEGSIVLLAELELHVEPTLSCHSDHFLRRQRHVGEALPALDPCDSDVGY